MFVLSTGPGAEPPKKPAPPLVGEPAAFIVGVNGYNAKANPPLKHAVRNAIALAKRFVALGYRVTLVTDTASNKLAGEEIGREKVELLTADTDVTLEKLWRRWAEDRFQDLKAPRSPFGVIAFCGHGQERDDPSAGGPYFLAANDTGSAGVRIRGLQEYCGQRELPVVMLMHMCRKEVKEKPEAILRTAITSASPATILRLRYGGNRFRLSEHRDVPLTIWATGKGGVAEDEENGLLGILAMGLKDEMGKHYKTFAARRLVEQRDGAADARETDLSLFTWFRYARYCDLSMDNSTNYVVDPGSINQQMIFASTDRARQTKLLNLAFGRTSLLSRWRWGAGEFEGEGTGRGLEINHPSTADRVRYVIGVLDKEYDTVGKSLVVECVALPPNGIKDPGKNLGVLIQPSDDSGSYHYSGWNKRVDLPYRHTTILKIPLDRGGPDRKLTRLSFAAPVGEDEVNAWPPGARLLITRMDLCDNALASEVQQIATDKPVDLVARWWVGDVLRSPSSKVTLSGKLDASRCLELTGGGGETGEWYGWGGAVFPSIYADPMTHALEVTLVDSGVKGETKLTVGFYAGSTVLAEKTLTLTAAKIGQPFHIELTKAGLPDYLAVTTDAPSLKVKVKKVSLVSLSNKK